MAEQDFSEIARLSERFNKDPKSRIFVQLADTYRKNNMIDEALDILHKGLAHHPDYPLAHLILGKCLYDKRMFEQAKDAFRKTLAGDPQNIVALRMLAQTCASTKDEQGQINAYKGLIAIDPFDAQAKEKLEQLQAGQRTEPLHTVSMAQEYETQGNTEKALEIYEHLLYTDPTDIGLQQKVKQLRAHVSEEKKTEEETGIEKLKVETFFHPDQLETKIPSVTEKDKPAPLPEQPSDDVMQLEDFLSSEPERAEPPVPPSPYETQPSENGEKSALPDESVEHPESVQPLEILQPFDDAPIPPGEKIEILEPTQAADIIQPENDETTSKPTIPPLEPKEPLVEPAVPESTPFEPEATSAVPPLKPEDEEPMAEPDEPPLPLLKDDDRSSPPEPPHVSEKAADSDEVLHRLEPIEETTPPDLKTSDTKTDMPVAPDTPAQESKTPEPQETPSADQTATTDDSSSTPAPATTPPPEKPKEEDFQSFQDWLSGLLK